MRLRYYGEVPNVMEAVEYYSNVFDIEVVKDGSTGHANFKLYGEITIMLHTSTQQSRKPGYYVIRFDDSQTELYKKAIAKIKASNLVSISIDEYKGRWGTTFFEFRDRYGYMWDLEIKS